MIDVQRSFLELLPPAMRDGLVARVAWLIRLAKVLEIPVMAMGEDLTHEGPLVDEIVAVLPPGTTVHDKHVFGLASQEDIRHTLESLGRNTPVLVGLETDVCVAHSALDLLDRGYRVVAIEDACGTPPPHHDSGLARMRDAGALILRSRALAFEWMRDLATMDKVNRALGGSYPPS